MTHVRARLRLPLVGVASLVAVACNLVTGVTDLQVSDGVGPFAPDASSSDGAADQTSPSVIDGGASLDAAVNPGPGDGDGGGCMATTAAPTLLLGVAAPLGSSYLLTPETNGLAGGIASASPVAIGDFDASFSYSITYSNASTPGAGLAFFALEGTAKDLPCQSGPNLCTLGGQAPGFAVILRTSKVQQSDPAVPYVAVVDAQTFPGTQPASTVLIDPAKAYSAGSGGGPAMPPSTSFHQMAISVRAGKVTASIDGVKVLASVAIPNWTPGRVSTWGVGSATGQGNSYAERTVVGQVTMNRCP